MKVREHVTVGQVWRSNDPRRLRGIRVLRTGEGAMRDYVRVVNIVNGRETVIRRDQFCTGQRGWSLEKEASREDRTSRA